MRQGRSGGQRMGFAGQDLRALGSLVDQFAATRTAGPRFSCLRFDQFIPLAERPKYSVFVISVLLQAGGDGFGMSRRLRFCSRRPDPSPRSFAFASISLLPKGPPCLA